MLLEHSRTTHRHQAFTLIEMIVVVLLITLFIAILTPTLRAARSQSKTDICLANLKSMGNALRIYAETYGTLPGPIHPGIYHHLSVQYLMEQGYGEAAAKMIMNRQMIHLLGFTIPRNDAERIARCPTMAGSVPDTHFDNFSDTQGYWVQPTHYCANNVSEATEASDNRSTVPPNYFGIAPYGVKVPPPCRFAQIPNPAREWATADAWYRPRYNTMLPFLQQEGPYQWEYSGLAMPNFAPHLRTAGTSYNYTTRDNREAQSIKSRAQKSDGATNTLFFDGHAAPIPSRTAILAGFELLYGFPGTVNPDLTPQQQNYWNYITWH